MQNQTKYTDITTLNKLPNNPRFIKDNQFSTLVKSIKDSPDYFEARPIICSDRTGSLIILAGNQRYEAAKFLKLKEVPVYVMTGLTEVREREIVIRDNVSNGEWDLDILANEWDMGELISWGIDIPSIDLGIPDEIEAEEDDFEVPEDINEIQTNLKTGDVIDFRKGILHHRLVCGDSTKEADVRLLMGDRLADLVITDPPYNVAYEGGTQEKLTIMNDSMSDGNFRQFLIDAFLQLNNSMKRGAAFYIWHADSEGFNFRSACKDTGWKIRQCLIWVKNSMVMGRQDYQWKHEPCLYGWKDGAGHFFTDARTNTTVIEDKIEIKKLTKAEMIALLEEIFADKTSTSVIHENKPTRNAEHPTMKPIRLLARAVKNSSKPGQLVLDTFAGSGSTGVASHQLGRNCYMMEMDPKYAFIIAKRMKQLDNDLVITCINRTFDINQELEDALER